MATTSTLTRQIMEGRAKLQLSGEAGEVFYNPKMSLNRDFALLFTNSYFQSKAPRICDPMTGTGVRAVRYALEGHSVASVLASDRDSTAAEAARQTVRLNQVEDKVSVACNDAHQLLAQHSTDRFDLIDLDPFGSPAPFFEAALRATNSDGILAATATDMAPLSGARVAACLRKYGITALRTEFEKEIAIRALASCLATIAARQELGIDIAFSHATDHYARLYAVITKGRRAANQTLRNLGYLTYCARCLSRKSVAISSVQSRCEYCQGSIRTGGPFWMGSLWDARIVETMSGHAAALSSRRLSDVQRILNLVQSELACSKFHYTTDSIASAFGAKPPPIAWLVQSLREAGYEASSTHFNFSGFRTNAPVSELRALFRRFSDDA